jgi:hypothetical protein
VAVGSLFLGPAVQAVHSKWDSTSSAHSDLAPERHCLVGPAVIISFVQPKSTVLWARRQLYHSLTLPAVGTLKRYSKALEYEYRVKTVALGTLKRYSIISLNLYLEWYGAYSVLYSGGSH